MKTTHNPASFDDAFGENKGNDALFFLDDVIASTKQQV